MADGSKIEWTDATWNVVIGCDKVSPGCDHCYAIRTAHRMQANPNPKIAAAYAGTEADGEWTGQVNLVEDRLELPLSWTRPRRIFVNAQSDLFHKDVPDEFIARVWAVMALAPQHTFQILTKRHGRMRSLLAVERLQRPRSRRESTWTRSTLRPLDGSWR
jgi:protein gp37